MSVEGKQITDYTIFNKNPWLIAFFKNSNLVDILESNDTQFNELEDVFYQLLLEMWLDTAIGEQLDVLGIHIGIDRDGRTDSEYRAVLISQININVSSGEPEALIDAVRILFNTSNVLYKPEYPAKVIIWTDATLPVTPAQLEIILRSLLDIVPSGVGLLWSDNLIDHTGDLIVTETGDEIICPFFIT